VRFRLEYYKMVKQVLKEHRQIIPCYSGFASAQISPWWWCLDVLHKSRIYR